jgi:colanic acid biosynthesis protein WcaH
VSDEKLIPESEYKTILENIPLPAVDLIVKCEDGVLLGRRTNSPAKDTWFVPGGRVHKSESLKNAVKRIAKDEIGTSVEIKQQVGSYSNKYSESEFRDISKHYITTLYIVKPLSENFQKDSQNSKLKIFASLPDQTHRHTIRYIRDCIEKDFLDETLLTG